MSVLLSVLYAVLTILGSYVLIMLLIVKRPNPAFKIDAIYITGLLLASVIWLLYHSGILIHFPHLLKISAPIALIMVPSALIATRLFLYDDKKIRNYEYLLFLPGLFYYIQLIPVFALSAAEKIEIINNSYIDPSYYWYKTNDGILKGSAYHVFSLVYNLVLLMLYFNMLRKYLSSVDFSSLNKEKRRVLYFISGKYYVFVLVYFIYLFANIVKARFPDLTFYLMMLTILLPLAFYVLFILFNPSILYGVYTMNLKTEHLPDNDSHIPLPEAGINTPGKILKSSPGIKDFERIKLIEEYLNNSQIYLQKDFSMEMLADRIMLSKKIIRKSLLLVYDVTFPVFVNQLRINYFVNQLKTGVCCWKSYSIVSISEMLGYSSPASFYNAFKSVYDCTPKEFLDKLNLPESN